MYEETKTDNDSVLNESPLKRLEATSTLRRNSEIYLIQPRTLPR